MNCPSCKSKFDEVRDGGCHCPNCGWMKKVDNKWLVLEKEPPKIQEPEPKPEPKPMEEKRETIDEEKTPDEKEKIIVRKHLFGLVTTTQKIGIPD